jgi:RNA polymerase sigma factor (TIGR02999 family)
MAGENPGQTLQATALVHEAYVRLVGSNQTLKWDSRGHFFAAAAEAMRRILIDNARRKKAQKHGGGLVRVLFPEDMIPTESDDQLLALDEALARLNALDPIKAELVRLCFWAFLRPRQTDTGRMRVPGCIRKCSGSLPNLTELWTYFT